MEIDKAIKKLESYKKKKCKPIAQINLLFEKNECKAIAYVYVNGKIGWEWQPVYFNFEFPTKQDYIEGMAIYSDDYETRTFTVECHSFSYNRKELLILKINQIIHYLKTVKEDIF